MLAPTRKDASRADRNGKGTFEAGGTKGVEVPAMAMNALSFLIGVVLPLGGTLWLLLH
jgi:hypothetical protein